MESLFLSFDHTVAWGFLMNRFFLKKGQGGGRGVFTQACLCVGITQAC